jgi:hypothetical protein
MTIERLSPRLGAAGVVLTIAALLAGCSSSNNGMTTSGSIDLAITPDSATIPQGQTVTVHGTVSRSAGFTGQIGIDVVNVPTGVIPTQVVRPVNGSDTTVVTLGVGSAVTLGQYTLTFQASSAGVTTIGKPFKLTVVTAQPSAYTIGLSTPVLTLTPGGDGVLNISLTRAFFNDAITLSASQLPDGVTATFSPNPVTGDSSVVTFVTAASASLGTDTLFIRGTAAGLADRVDTLPVHIVAGS